MDERRGEKERTERFGLVKEDCKLIPAEVFVKFWLWQLWPSFLSFFNNSHKESGKDTKRYMRNAETNDHR